MDQGPLVNDQIEAGTHFIERFENYAPVRVAFWLKRADDDDAGHWYLQVASDAIDETNFDVGYGEVLRVAAGMPEPKIDPFRVKLAVGAESLVRAVEALQRRFPGTAVTHHHDRLLGNVAAEEVYVYPPRVTAS